MAAPAARPGYQGGDPRKGFSSTLGRIQENVPIRETTSLAGHSYGSNSSLGRQWKGRGSRFAA